MIIYYYYYYYHLETSTFFVLYNTLSFSPNQQVCVCIYVQVHQLTLPWGLCRENRGKKKDESKLILTIPFPPVRSPGSFKTSTKQKIDPDLICIITIFFPILCSFRKVFFFFIFRIKFNENH